MGKMGEYWVLPRSLGSECTINPVEETQRTYQLYHHRPVVFQMAMFQTPIAGCFSAQVLAQQDCANWTCPEGHQAKANAESIFLSLSQVMGLASSNY